VIIYTSSIVSAMCSVTIGTVKWTS